VLCLRNEGYEVYPASFFAPIALPPALRRAVLAAV
jgi:hypothetical protein